VVRLNDSLTGLLPFPDGQTYREITPSPGYVEGSYMLKRRGTYYLMWSEGEWTGPDYCVAYATAPTALGPFTVRGRILQQDPLVARGAGHHSVLRIPGTEDWIIVYHRRPIGDEDGNHRELAIDRLYFCEDGSIGPVEITREGVGARPLR
jgi:beta-xylosidase